MDVHKSSLLAIFEAKQRLDVPLFQRQYVWSEEQQWLPLWEDIERKFTEALEGRQDAPNHFLGAMVLDQKQTPTGHVVIRQIIDGQQRLTTLQIFLAAYRDFCKTQECEALAAECDKFLFNTGMMADKEVDQFKVWPTQLDRPQFKDVIGSGSLDEVLKRHPLQRRPYARRPDPRPRMIEAYLFFFEQVKVFFLGEDGEPPLASEHFLFDRLDECFQTLRNGLMVAVIDLQQDDDPQVIFETLNARGEPLLPADLLKNYIFFRVNREGKLDVESAYDKYWSRFDDIFWRQEVKQGRLTRPRSDLFMQHFLASHQGRDIPIKHLYVEYRRWIEHDRPFPNVTAELETLARQGDNFRRIIAPAKADVVYELCTFLEIFDIRTAYPLLLTLMETELSNTEWVEVSEILESFLLRRAICNYGTKNYNRMFLALARNLRRDVPNAEHLKGLLLTQRGQSVEWPDDVVLRSHWLNQQAYSRLTSAQLVHLFTRLNQTFMSSKSENIGFTEAPTIEHIMPQTWVPNWPLRNGTKGMHYWEYYNKTEPDDRATASRERDTIVQTLGNLTLLSTGLNSSQSNLTWDQKKQEIRIHSLLPINQRFLEIPVWDEDAITMRGEDLFERARTIWRR
jgi:uncharacterized protein DUF262/uncharacterized protein DUF1524